MLIQTPGGDDSIPSKACPVSRTGNDNARLKYVRIITAQPASTTR